MFGDALASGVGGHPVWGPKHPSRTCTRSAKSLLKLHRPKLQSLQGEQERIRHVKVQFGFAGLGHFDSHEQLNTLSRTEEVLARACLTQRRLAVAGAGKVSQ